MEAWTYSWAFRNLIAELLMPPGIWTLIALLGLCCFKHRHRLQKMIVVVSLMMIWVTSTPVFAGWLTHQLNVLMNWPQAIDISRLLALARINSPL